jgi:phosphatidylglycerophosphate synthase
VLRILRESEGVVTAGTALCYAGASSRPGLLLWAVGLTLLRMTLNTMDGVIAIARGSLSLKGEIVNALPDRYSDFLLLGGLALSPLCGPVYGLLGLSSMFLVSYAGMLGKALGVEWQHHGPLGKVERLILVMIFSLVQYVQICRGTETLALFGLTLTPLQWCMVLFVGLGQVAVFNRVKGMLRQIRKREWPGRSARYLGGRRVLVTCDSQTGNTGRVAAAIAEALRADLVAVEDVEDLDGYHLVVLGTPNIRGKPSGKVLRFLEEHPDLSRYAVFVTYGMPLWGPVSTRMCFSRIRELAGKAPLATFACKGRHVKYKTYKGRPNEDDLLSAYLFGVRLARVVSEQWNR